MQLFGLWIHTIINMSTLVMTNPAIMPHSSSPPSWRFTSRQTMSSGATTSAGRAKKDWGSPGKVLMATEIKFLGRDSHPMSQNYQDI